MSHERPLIIADESVDRRIIESLRNSGFIVHSIIEESAGIGDNDVMRIAVQKNGLIVNEDKDFGDELVYK